VWDALRKIDTAYNTALTRAKILDRDVNFHTLRHTFASHYVMRGGSIVKLQAILGHARVRTTQIYSRLAPDHLIRPRASSTAWARRSLPKSTHRQRMGPSASLAIWKVSRKYAILRRLNWRTAP